MGDNHGVYPSESDIPVDIEYDPELYISTISLVQLFQGDKC